MARLRKDQQDIQSAIMRDLDAVIRTLAEEGVDLDVLDYEEPIDPHMAVAVCRVGEQRDVKIVRRHPPMGAATHYIGQRGGLEVPNVAALGAILRMCERVS